MLLCGMCNSKNNKNIFQILQMKSFSIKSKLLIVDTYKSKRKFVFFWGFLPEHYTNSISCINSFIITILGFYNNIWAANKQMR